MEEAGRLLKIPGPAYEKEPWAENLCTLGTIKTIIVTFSSGVELVTYRWLCTVILRTIRIAFNRLRLLGEKNRKKIQKFRAHLQ